MSSKLNNWKKQLNSYSLPSFMIFINQPASQPDSQTRQGSFYRFAIKVFFFKLISLLCCSAGISHIPANSSSLSALKTVLFFFISFPLIDFCVCLSLSSLAPDLLWYDVNVQYFCDTSNSGVRQKVCSTLVLLKNNSIRHGQGLIHCLTAASCSAVLCCCLMKWFGGSRDVWFFSTLLNHSGSVFVCLFVWERKSHILLLQ